MSKKQKLAKKEARASQKLYDGEEKIEETEEVKSEQDLQTLSSQEEEKSATELANTENTSEKSAENAAENVTENVAEKKDQKKVEKTKKDKKGKKKDEKKGIVKRTKETASELKKVTWPSFGEVVKKTGIVIAFVIIFGLLIFGIDTLLSYLSGLLLAY